MTKTRIRISPLMVDATSCDLSTVRAELVGKCPSNHRGRGFMSTSRFDQRKFEQMVRDGFAYVMDYPHNVT